MASLDTEASVGARVSGAAHRGGVSRPGGNGTSAAGPACGRPHDRGGSARAHRGHGLWSGRVLAGRRLERLGHAVAVIDRDAAGVPPARRRLPRAAGRRHRLRPGGAARGRDRGGRRVRRRVQRATTRTSSRPGSPGRRSASSASSPGSTTPSAPQVYERLGIPTVATVPWTTDRLLRMLMPERRGQRLARPVRDGRDRAAAAPRGLGRALASPSWRQATASASRSSSGSAPAAARRGDDRGAGRGHRVTSRRGAGRRSATWRRPPSAPPEEG